MVRGFTISDDALDALRRARRWLTQPGSGPTGRQRWAALRDVRRSLLTAPYLGLVSSDHAGHRQHVIHGYRIIYRVNPDTGDAATAGDIEVAAVLAPGQP